MTLEAHILGEGVLGIEGSISELALVCKISMLHVVGMHGWYALALKMLMNLLLIGRSTVEIMLTT